MASIASGAGLLMRDGKSLEHNSEASPEKLPDLSCLADKETIQSAASISLGFLSDFHKLDFQQSIHLYKATPSSKRLDLLTQIIDLIYHFNLGENQNMENLIAIIQNEIKEREFDQINELSAKNLRKLGIYILRCSKNVQDFLGFYSCLQDKHIEVKRALITNVCQLKGHDNFVLDPEFLFGFFIHLLSSTKFDYSLFVYELSEKAALAMLDKLQKSEQELKEVNENDFLLALIDQKVNGHAISQFSERYLQAMDIKRSDLIDEFLYHTGQKQRANEEELDLVGFDEDERSAISRFFTCSSGTPISRGRLKAYLLHTILKDGLILDLHESIKGKLIQDFIGIIQSYSQLSDKISENDTLAFADALALLCEPMHIPTILRSMQDPFMVLGFMQNILRQGEQSKLKEAFTAYWKISYKFVIEGYDFCMAQFLPEIKTPMALKIVLETMPDDLPQNNPKKPVGVLPLPILFDKISDEPLIVQLLTGVSLSKEHYYKIGMDSVELLEVLRNVKCKPYKDNEEIINLRLKSPHVEL